MKFFNRKKTVCIAMSGGVDSSVAAALLKKQGYNCIGVFFVTWTQNIPGLTMCPWEQDALDARQVCAALDIPLYTFNFEEEYKRRVLEYFLSEHKAGRTPNPDVACNREIKFGVFLEKALELGADYIATGHYARVKKNRRGFELHKSKDNNKDQSYFLYSLTQKELSHTLFPIGNLKKPKVRKLAKKFKLPNWDKKDSQGICFLGDVELKTFLQNYIKQEPGDIITTNDQKVGTHDGLTYYTIGQRHGLHLGGASEPYYAVAKDEKNNILIVGHENDPALFKSELSVKAITWVNGEPKFPLICKSKIRYRQPDQSVRISADLLATFTEPQRAVTPGQSIVLYDKTRVVGGGIIS